jgi:hypothetical protein
MPESWNAGEYRNRATVAEGGVAPEGREREACFALAEGNVRLAELIEAQQGTSIAAS